MLFVYDVGKSHSPPARSLFSLRSIHAERRTSISTSHYLILPYCLSMLEKGTWGELDQREIGTPLLSVGVGVVDDDPEEVEGSVLSSFDVELYVPSIPYRSFSYEPTTIVNPRGRASIVDEVEDVVEVEGFEDRALEEKALRLIESFGDGFELLARRTVFFSFCSRGFLDETGVVG